VVVSIKNIYPDLTDDQKRKILHPKKKDSKVKCRVVSDSDADSGSEMNDDPKPASPKNESSKIPSNVLPTDSESGKRNDF